MTIAGPNGAVAGMEKLKCRPDRVFEKDARINTRALGQPYIHNGMYHTPDAEIYASMILQHNPPQIIELGAGFSTLIARKTLQTQPKPGRLVVRSSTTNRRRCGCGD